MCIYAVLILLLTFANAADLNAELAKKLFNAFDANGNNEISKVEYHDFFVTFDTNGNAKITREELTCAVNKLDAAFAGIEGALFQLLDTDLDGQVDNHDLGVVFELCDRNHDCVIDKPEFLHVFNAVAAMVG